MVIPSIALIPSGYKGGVTLGKLYSVLPTNGNADLDVVRNSTANRINKDKLIESMAINVPLLDYSDSTCPSLLLQPQSTNLITYPLSFGNSYWTKSGASIEGDASTAGAEKVVNGDFATDTDWNKNTNWTISAGAANADGTSNGNINQGADDTVIGATFIVTYDITSYTSGTFYPQYGGVALTPRSAVGTYAEQVTTISNLRLSFRGTLPLGSIDNLSVKEVQGFSAPSVDNPTSAFKLVEDTSTGVHRVLKESLTGVSGDKFSNSIRIKSSGRQWVLLMDNHSNKGYYFDIINGVVGSAFTGGTDSFSITPLADGWFDISITVITESNLMSLQLRLADADGSNSYTGNGTSGVYIFGAQLEALPCATSLMLPVLPAVEGTSASRLKDEVSKTGLSSEINSVEGTLFVEMSALVDDLSERRLSLSDSISSNVVRVGYTNISNRIIAVVFNGSNQAVMTYTSSDITVKSKIAVKYKENDFALWVDGVERAIDSIGTTFSENTLNRIGFDGGSGVSNSFNKTNQLQVFKTALTDAELAVLTTI